MAIVYAQQNGNLDGAPVLIGHECHADAVRDGQNVTVTVTMWSAIRNADVVEYDTTAILIIAAMVAHATESTASETVIKDTSLWSNTVAYGSAPPPTMVRESGEWDAVNNGVKRTQLVLTVQNVSAGTTELALTTRCTSNFGAVCGTFQREDTITIPIAEAPSDITLTAEALEEITTNTLWDIDCTVGELGLNASAISEYLFQMDADNSGWKQLQRSTSPRLQFYPEREGVQPGAVISLWCKATNNAGLSAYSNVFVRKTMDLPFPPVINISPLPVESPGSEIHITSNGEISINNRNYGTDVYVTGEEVLDTGASSFDIVSTATNAAGSVSTTLTCDVAPYAEHATNVRFRRTDVTVNDTLEILWDSSEGATAWTVDVQFGDTVITKASVGLRATLDLSLYALTPKDVITVTVHVHNKYGVITPDSTAVATLVLQGGGMYIKRADGTYGYGLVHVKTAAGWQPATRVYIKTFDGWKLSL